MIRSFVALHVSLPDPLRDIYDELSEEFSRGFKWVPENQVHLTIKFLGDTNSLQVEQIKKAVAVIAGNVEPLSLYVKGIGAFPNLKNPTVVWAGIEKNERLEKLFLDVNDAAYNAGFETELHTYKPHLTLARIKRDVDTSILAKRIISLKDNDYGCFTCETVTYFESQLFPTGPIYKKLGEYRMGKF